MAECKNHGKCGYQGKGHNRRLVLCSVCQRKLDEYRRRKEDLEIRDALGRGLRHSISEEDNKPMM